MPPLPPSGVTHFVTALLYNKRCCLIQYIGRSKTHRLKFCVAVGKMKAAGVLAGLLVLCVALATWKTIAKSLRLVLRPAAPYNEVVWLGRKVPHSSCMSSTWKSKTDIGGIAADAMRITREANPTWSFGCTTTATWWSTSRTAAKTAFCNVS